MVLRKLVTADLSHHRVRSALTVTSIALAVSLVVSVTSGYASLESAVYKYLGQYMGTVDVEVYRANDAAAGTSEQLLDNINNDPDVRRADGRYETSGVLSAPNAEGEPRVAVIGVDRPGDNRSDYLNLEPGTGGGWFGTNDANVAVIDQAVAKNLHVSVGEAFTLPGAADASLTLKVAAIVHKPEMLAPFMQTIYVPLRTLQRFAGKERVISRVMIDLKPGANVDVFADRWRPRLREIDPNLKVRLAREARKEMSKNLAGIHALSYMGGTVSMLAATFIVFSALSMGVSERQRTLAMLRAVGAQKSQVGSLVVIEAIMLASLGAAIGVPLGWLWINVLAGWFSEYFSAGVTPSWGGICFGALGSMLAALGASIMPALSATRVDPLEAMNPHADPPAKGPPVRSFVVALAMLTVDPFLMFGPVESILRTLGASDPLATTRFFTFYAHFAVGLPLLLIGFFLVAPMFVWVIERVAGPIVAPMFGLKAALLRQQLSTGIWRVAGTCAALMVGLAVLVVLQTNGNTMISGWILPTKFPDIFVMTSPFNGISQKQVELLESVPGIKKGEVMPIGIASPEYGAKFASIAMAAVMPNATMYLGVDPDRAFKMMGLEFREGSADEATKLLKQGDHLVITEEFRQLKNLHVGSTFSLKTNQGDHDFTVAAVVWSPGIEVMVSMYDMNRQFDQRTAASVFGSLADGRKYFGINDVYLFAANLEPGMERPDFVKQLEKKLGKTGMSAGDVRQIKTSIQTGLRRLLLLITTVAFAAMAVSSLGVTNTILASIRSRRWQFGVLRSIGITRSQLLRLIIAEAFLIGLIGSVLGLAAGALMTVDANALSHVLTGYRPPVAVPWGIIAVGTVIVMMISILASLWPAISVSRTQPLDLLQAGRATA